MGKQVIGNVTKTIGGFLNNNSPTILTGLSVAGMLTTTIMAVNATPKAIEILDNEQFKRIDEHLVYGEKILLPKKDIILLTWKCYIPSAIMGAATIACIIGANSINLRRNAALASAYSLTETALKEYKSKVVETIGKTKERKIKDDIAKDKITNNPVGKNEVIITGKGETLCYDALSGRYFRSNVEDINKALNGLSHRLMSEMFISLNEVYYALGMDETKVGELLGWDIDNVDDDLIKADFSTQLAEDNNPCLVLDFETQPIYCDRNY